MRKSEPDEVWGLLDLDRPSMKHFAASLRDGDPKARASALLAYFRQRPRPVYPTRQTLEADGDATEAVLAEADDALRHVFLARWDMRDQLGYRPQDYGPDIDWDADPVGNNNWVACMHRFTWDHSLASAYLATGDEKYARGWLELAGDWIDKNPPDPQRFGYKALQLGVRAIRWCADFDLYLKSPHLTGDFLLRFLAALHDHALKALEHTDPSHHNPRIIELEAPLRIALVFPEFKAADRWFERAAELLDETVARQVTPEGVQAEWSINYHMAVLGRLMGVVELATGNGRTLPPRLMGVIERMGDYLAAAISPDGLYPMFGDARRPSHAIGPSLRRTAATFHKPQHLAILDGSLDGCPSQLSWAFPQSGMYYLRSGWGPDATYLALHCSPPAVSSHDQPDNGTFELYANGRWIMPDTGCYVYAGKPFVQERPAFRATAAHQTVTLDGADSKNAARHLLWHSGEDFDAVAFENQSYEQLLHRRTVWFIGRAFFVILDEALGEAAGTLAQHFQLAAGPWVFDPAWKRAYTVGATDEEMVVRIAGAQASDGGHRASHRTPGVLVWTPPDAPTDMIEEKGQVSHQFHVKQPRPAFALRHRRAAPASWWAVIVPMLGNAAPEVSLDAPREVLAGEDRIEARVFVAGDAFAFGRDLRQGAAWCARQ